MSGIVLYLCSTASDLRYVTNSVEHSRYLDADSRLASQEIPGLLRTQSSLQCSQESAAGQRSRPSRLRKTMNILSHNKM
jgi:hypothetical protein